ncbi:uncharacterized protein LOC127879791 [Dreissena polymorpha]|uniref:Uncharacterized protein n=1 Tax=Dreissena polymorpha TaxID=45954 RepID=A0A9D4H6B9_DREPO|nr:uncharacterized protein LOC127879791 [Dreissena polymorpha]KAH3830364.1 hypothetical protein DPMN_103606 [Dreissena polymorpha]
MQSPVLCAFILVTAGLQLITADHPKLMNAATDVQPHGCSTFMFEGKGDFRVQRKIYATQNPDHFVFALRLIKRTSFYKCEPQETRYGITDDGHSWWVDRGCEAIFEVTECPNNGLLPSPDPLSKLYEEMQRRLAASTSNVDLSAWNTDSFINRFDAWRPIVESKGR